jgi:hypothetical protein
MIAPKMAAGIRMKAAPESANPVSRQFNTNAGLASANSEF